MRPFLAFAPLVLPAGCVGVFHNSNTLAVDVRGPAAPPVVIRTQNEFDTFLAELRSRPGWADTNDPDGLAERLETSRPDFDRQVLVVVRHDSTWSSRFGFFTSDRFGVLVCHIVTLKRGYNRDHSPHWFAVAVPRPGPTRVEVRIDGRRQPDEVRVER
jgi:hypothetical protein